MTYSTLAAPARFDLLVRKSRFVAQAGAIDTAEDASAFIASMRSTDASHHCWAYRIGAAYRSFDDGEPSGTAGRPILAAIEAQHCDHVAVLVARWFGGIKLGAGGLMRAYGGARFRMPAQGPTPAVDRTRPAHRRLRLRTYRRTATTRRPVGSRQMRRSVSPPKACA